MNHIHFCGRILFFLWLTVPLSVFGQTNGVLCLGNGEMMVYEQGSDIIQLFGPPYSSPTVLQLTLNDRTEVKSLRETHTAIWTHSLQNGSTKMTDFVSGNIPCFVRTVENSATLRFTLKLSAGTTSIDNTSVYRPDGLAHAMLLTSPAGAYAYKVYPTLIENNYQFMLKGDISISQKDNLTWEIVCDPGKSTIWIVSGRDYPHCVTFARQTLDTDHHTLLQQTRAYWQAFAADRIDFSKKIPENVPQRATLLQAIDDIAVLIKAQQGTEGSALAGYNFHLGYVRDQYGVSRCLLKLGHVKEAKALLQFYWDVWKRKGMIRNAQGIGLDAFHIHENDDVEITGYLVIQAFDYLKQTNDNTFIRDIFPMLEWAWDAQVKHLHHQMLPFNGDETYIAGGMLPRSVMFDGSAEATLLFLTGGRQLTAWVKNQKVWTAAKTTQAVKILDEVENRYADNFLKEGKLLTNNPERKQGLTLPMFRHGVCESCRQVTWTQRTTNDRYLCATCFPVKTLPDIQDEKYYIRSVSLIPWYIQSSIIPDSQVKQLLQEVIDAYAATGKLPSRPDGGRTVGYDYGLFLYSLTRINHPVKDKVYAQMLGVIDNTGSWVEYYQDDVPSGTFCRPWESAINLEAALEFAEKYK
jgi:hypothetical protein